MIGIYKIENFTKELVASLPDTLQSLEEIENYILLKMKTFMKKFKWMSFTI